MAKRESRQLSEPAVDVAECQRRIAYEFRDPGLLMSALTHASGAQHRLASNERLEFLGDAILGFVVCEMLYRLFPDSLEGDLTRIKSVVVSRETCSRVSEQLGLLEFLIVGKGLALHQPVPQSVLSDLFESVVAAMYLDGGLEPVRRLVERLVQRALAMEGTCTGEHGVGQGKMKYLEQEHGAEALAMMRALKLAIDPQNLMNPGKIVTL